MCLKEFSGFLENCHFLRPQKLKKTSQRIHKTFREDGYNKIVFEREPHPILNIMFYPPQYTPQAKGTGRFFKSGPFPFLQEFLEIQLLCIKLFGAAHNTGGGAEDERYAQ